MICGSRDDEDNLVLFSDLWGSLTSNHPGGMKVRRGALRMREEEREAVKSESRILGKKYMEIRIVN